MGSIIGIIGFLLGGGGLISLLMIRVNRDSVAVANMKEVVDEVRTLQEATERKVASLEAQIEKLEHTILRAYKCRYITDCPVVKDFECNGKYKGR